MAAASNGHLEAAQKLVAAGAALDKQNSDGHNALMFAYNGRAQVASLMDKYAEYLDEADDASGESTKMMREAMAHTQVNNEAQNQGSLAPGKEWLRGWVAFSCVSVYIMNVIGSRIRHVPRHVGSVVENVAASHHIESPPILEGCLNVVDLFPPAGF